MSLLWTMAFDHRDSFRTSFLGLSGAAADGDRTTARRAKGVIFDGLQRAVEQGISVGQPLALVDEEYGADVIARARISGMDFAVPVEASGRDELAFEHGDDGFGAMIERLDPAYAKVLVRYNPEGDAGLNARQRVRLCVLQQWVRCNGRRWMLELLVPPTTSQASVVDYDDAVRPALTVSAIEELRIGGLAPDLWKLEGMPSTAAYAAIADACEAGADDGPKCLVLGRGADTHAVDQWLTRAARVPGFAGFAVGRTIWWQPLRAALDGSITDDDAVLAIANNYRRLIDIYLRAKESSR